MRYILALDQGPTSSRAVAFDETGRMVGSHGIELPQHYPRPGWVEHDPRAVSYTHLDVYKRQVFQNQQSRARQQNHDQKPYKKTEHRRAVAAAPIVSFHKKRPP